MDSSSKRKRVDKKLTVCDLVRKKVSHSEINNRFNIGKSAISDIVQGEEKLKKCELGISKSVKKTKTMRGGKFDKLDQALYIWFRQMREKGVPVTGPILLEKANDYHALLYADSPKPFTASYGFQWRFCNRFGIKSLSICGEKLSADLISPDELVQNFAELTDGYTRDQIFNCDETGLYYKMLPDRALTTVDNDPIGAKKAKGRITINACANTAGTIKLTLLFIGKYNNPRCFRGINKETLPVIYSHQKKRVWSMTRFSRIGFRIISYPWRKKN